MQVEIRKVVDPSQVNLDDLSRKDKLILAIRSKYHQSRYYLNKQEKKREEALRKQVLLEDELKEQILSILYKELICNTTLSKTNQTTKKVYIKIKRRYKDILNNIRTHKDFLCYRISIVQEDPDVFRAINDLPIILAVERRILGGESDEK